MEVVSEIERERMSALLRSGKRIDGRDFDEFRPIKIVPGVVSKAEGSAEVWLGETRVITGVKVNVGKPFADTPEEGVIVFSAEMSPIGSPTFELGPPGEEAIELARVVDRGVRHSSSLQRNNLCITPGEHVYILFVDIYTLAYHGNLFDTSTLASVAALMTTQIPKVNITENGEVELLEEMEPLKMGPPPLSVTFAKIDDSIIADPVLEEERVMTARLTVCIDGDDTVCSMQKGGIGPFSRQEVMDCVDRACRIVKKLRGLLPQR